MKRPAMLLIGGGAIGGAIGYILGDVYPFWVHLVVMLPLCLGFAWLVRQITPEPIRRNVRDMRLSELWRSFRHGA
jgi:hypothetical protein